MNSMPYSIITPAHNEACFLPQVIQSIVNQTIQPRQWVILDDRSKDETWNIIKQAANRYTFIYPVKISGDDERRLGPNVVYLFNKGLVCIHEQCEFIVKMDADVILPKNYFNEMACYFNENPNLGIASGKTYVQENGVWMLERMPDNHASGACKSYRWNCFDAIGGLTPVLGWDIVDGAEARLKGWQTMSFRNLPLYHLRHVGTATGVIKGKMGHGRGMYAICAHPLFVLARSIYRSIERPPLAGIFIMVGYLLALLKRETRLQDRELIRFLRKEQLNRVLGRTMSQEELIVRRL